MHLKGAAAARMPIPRLNTTGGSAGIWRAVFVLSVAILVMDPLPVPRAAVNAPTEVNSLQAGAQAVIAAAVPTQRQARHDAHQATQSIGMTGGPMRGLATSLQPLGDRAWLDKDCTRTHGSSHYVRTYSWLVRHTRMSSLAGTVICKRHRSS